jgi:hypothetical protein
MRTVTIAVPSIQTAEALEKFLSQVAPHVCRLVEQVMNFTVDQASIKIRP